MDLKTSYQQHVDKYASEVAALRRKNNGSITGELLSFGAILTFVVCYIAMDEGSSRWLLGAVLALIAYFNIRRLDDKNKEKIAHLSALLAVIRTRSEHWRAISRLSKWAINTKIHSMLIPSISMSLAGIHSSIASAAR